MDQHVHRATTGSPATMAASFLRTLIIHEWLTNYAGSERVVAELRVTFPGATVATSMRFGDKFEDWDVITSFLQPAARGSGSHLKALPLMPFAFRSLRLPPADLVITSFHTFALHARVPTDTPHIAYCYTPPRFLWHTEQFAARSRVDPLRQLALAPLRTLDRRRALRGATTFVAISRGVADRIRTTYGIESEVVHPPVEVERYARYNSAAQGDYFLVLSRLVPYKRVALAVDAFNRLGLPLIVAGEGRAAAALKQRAGPNIQFIGRVADEDVPPLMAGARALVFPGEDDFGIAPVEAMAAGTPVVAYGAGGALDTVQEGRNGVFFAEQVPDALAAAVREVASRSWDREDVSASVSGFSAARFRDEMLRLAAKVASVRCDLDARSK